VYRWEDPERAIEAIQFDPFHSPWAPAATAQPVVTQAPPPEEAADMPADEAVTPPPLTTEDFKGAVADYERLLLENALKANRFNQRATAAAIGLSYDQLRHALKRHKLLETDAA
jgi:psp operon transcriptional activator